MSIPRSLWMVGADHRDRSIHNREVMLFRAGFGRYLAALEIISITVHLFEFSTFVWIQYIQIDNIFSCLVKSNPVNLVTRHTTYIGPSPTVSVLRSYPVYLERPSIPYSPISDLLVGTPIRIFFCSVQQMIQLWYLGIDEEFVSYLGINKIIFVLWWNVIKMAIMY